MKKKIIGVVGKTGRGKDTFSKVLSQVLDLPLVCSYTTRDMRPGEVDGREHHFISKLRMQFLRDEAKIIAYAKKESGVEYCVTEDLIPPACIYIIDPEGIHYLRERFADKFELYVVELTCPDEVVHERIKERGDNYEKYLSRLKDEEEEWGNFHDNKEYDVSISSNQPVDEMIAEFLSAYKVE